MALSELSGTKSAFPTLAKRSAGLYHKPTHILANSKRRPNMLDHFSISVKDYEQSLKFYDETLGLLGMKRLMSFDVPEHQANYAGYGRAEKPRPAFWISSKGSAEREEEEVGRARGVHFAFEAPDANAVKAWHTKCLELGGRDNGAPGPRAEYHPGYFGAFIVDPNGWRIEACFHGYKP